jgi:hypothetical protein
VTRSTEILAERGKGVHGVITGVSALAAQWKAFLEKE